MLTIQERKSAVLCLWKLFARGNGYCIISYTKLPRHFKVDIGIYRYHHGSWSLSACIRICQKLSCILFAKSLYIPTMNLHPDANMPLYSIYVQIVLLGQKPQENSTHWWYWLPSLQWKNIQSSWIWTQGGKGLSFLFVLLVCCFWFLFVGFCFLWNW